jgi:hypothetical protein
MTRPRKSFLGAAPLGFGRTIAILFAVSAGPVLAAQSSSPWEAEWKRTVKAAEQEGEVSFYTLGDYGYLPEFEKRFPRIKVKIVPGKGAGLLSRIMTERRADKHLVDVARIGNTSPYSLYQAKVLQPIAQAFLLPEVKDQSKW